MFGLDEKSSILSGVFVNTLAETTKRLYLYADKNGIQKRVVDDLLKGFMLAAQGKRWPHPEMRVEEIGSLYDKEYN